MPFDNSRIASYRRVERSMRRHADTMLVSPATKCPFGVQAANLTANRGDVNCTLCGGLGWIYGTAVQMLAVVTDYDLRRDPQDVGVVEPGDLWAELIPRQAQRVNEYDKVEFPFYEYGEPYEGELVVRGAGATDTVRYEIVEVVACISTPANGTMTTYVQGTDFTVSGRTITWITALVPGTIYSIKYRARFIWICIEPPRPRYARGTDIGQRALLRKRELVFPDVGAAND